MGKTQILGSLVNTILTDSSNNVGLGGAANASFKLQVTGATNLTGALTGAAATFSGNLLVGPTTSGFDSVSQIASSSTGNIISALTLQNTSLTETAGTGVNLNFGGRLNWLGRISTQFVGTTGGGDASMSFLTPSGGTLAARLTIASTGAATFTNTGSASYGLTVANSSDNLRLRLGTTTGGYLNIQGQITSSGNPFNMSLQADGGNVGIGTSTINASSGYTMLRINGGSGSEFSLAQGGTDYAYMYANSGIFAIATQAAIPLTFQTNATERMRISSLGALTYNTTDAQGWFAGFSVSGTNFAYMGSTSQFANSGGTATDFGIRSANAMAFYTSGGNERMRITSDGKALFGTTNTSPSSGIGIKLLLDSSEPFMSIVSNATYCYFYNPNAGAYRFFVSGSGQINATSTSITAISDISLKENIRDLDTGLNEILKLKPRLFDWKEETKIGEKNVAGFIAQEVQPILPELVYDYKYNENETKKSIKMGDILPTLVKAMQEQQAQIEELKAIVATK
jgi:hypothetical protein